MIIISIIVFIVRTNIHILLLIASISFSMSWHIIIKALNSMTTILIILIVIELVTIITIVICIITAIVVTLLLLFVSLLPLSLLILHSLLLLVRICLLLFLPGSFGPRWFAWGSCFVVWPWRRAQASGSMLDMSRLFCGWNRVLHWWWRNHCYMHSIAPR